MSQCNNFCVHLSSFFLIVSDYYLKKKPTCKYQTKMLHDIILCVTIKTFIKRKTLFAVSFMRVYVCSYAQAKFMYNQCLNIMQDHTP